MQRGDGAARPTTPAAPVSLRAQEDGTAEPEDYEAGPSGAGGLPAPPGGGEAPRRPQDSVYWHPTLNPMGVPPPGKPQK